MYNMKKFLLLSIAILGLSVSEAQYYLLPVVKNGQNPSNLNKDFELQQGAGLTSGWFLILQGFQPAGNWSSTFTLPFKFYYYGSLVTRFKASTSGVVTFNSKTALKADSNNIALPTSRIPDSSICIWGLRASMGDYVLTKTFGTAPHRQFWISYNSFSELNLKSGGHIFAAIVLEESTNKIFIVDQRTQCMMNNVPCSDKTSLTLGLQLDSLTAIMVPGSPDFQSDNQNDPSPADNSYYEFIPGTIPNHDVESQKQIVNQYNRIGDFPLSIVGRFKNIGSNTITKVTYNYSVDNGPVITDEITGLNAASFEEFQLSHKTPWQITDTKYTTHTLVSWVSHINDEPASLPADDTLFSTIIVNDTFITRKLLHETFTSSTSQQAKTGSDTLHSVLSNHPGLYTELNYPMGNPQGGDPYTTIESSARSRFYNSGNTIPLTFLDGTNSISPAAYSSTTFLQFQDIPSFYQIIPSGLVTGQQIDIRVELKNEAPIPANTKLYVVVSEKQTTKNVKNNGQTSFEHVMKKFLPDTLGTSFGSLDADSDTVVNLSWTVPGTYRLPPDGRANNIINLLTEHSIEDFSNLEVVAWLQRSDRTVLQSNSADLAFKVSTTNPVIKKEITITPNPVSDYFFMDLSSFSEQNELNVLIADATGNVFHAEKTSLKSQFVNTSNWKPGVYYIRVHNKNQEGLKKVVVID
jgi:hypothetical protein